MCESEEAIKVTRILEPGDIAQLVKCLPGQQEGELGSVPSTHKNQGTAVGAWNSRTKKKVTGCLTVLRITDSPDNLS